MKREDKEEKKKERKMESVPRQVVCDLSAILQNILSGDYTNKFELIKEAFTDALQDCSGIESEYRKKIASIMGCAITAGTHAFFQRHAESIVELEKARMYIDRAILDLNFLIDISDITENEILAPASSGTPMPKVKPPKHTTPSEFPQAVQSMGGISFGRMQSALKNVARLRHVKYKSPRWHFVSQLFGHGSTISIQICENYDIDPHEYIGGEPQESTLT